MTTTATDWSMRLGASGELVEDIQDIHQCIRIIVRTPKGSDPLRPLFGCDAWLWQDAPIDVALPHVVRDVYAALQAWEPRAALVGVQLVPVSAEEGHWSVRITWQPVSGGDVQTTEVMYGG